MTEPAALRQADSDPEFVLEIRPEPTDEERDAILAALAILLTEPVAAIASGHDPNAPTRWARAGRMAAMNARQLRRGWNGK